MLSLPMIAPRAGASLWPSHRISHNNHDDPSTSPPNPSSQRRPTSHHSNPHHHHNHLHGRSATSQLLAALAHDENTIEQRKQNVRRFGSGWIRPAGVAKTLQATRDEELEKEEQEMLARREQVMMDLAAAQQDAANAEAREAGEEGEEDEEQRDLDDEVPEAEASVSESSVDSDMDSANDGESGSEVGENDTTVPFNEDSFIEGSMHEAEVSHMLEMEEAEMAGVLQDERDLDDDVPEAGSYEHTDSELEDSSDEDDNSRLPGMSSAARRSSRRISGMSTRSGRSVRSRRSGARRSSGLPAGMGNVPTLQVGPGPGLGRGRGLDLGVDLGNGRSSFGMDGSSSIMEGSSFLRSSPAATASRGVARNLFEGMRGGRGRFG